MSHDQWVQFTSEVETQRGPDAMASFLSYLEDAQQQLKVQCNTSTPLPSASAATPAREAEPHLSPCLSQEEGRLEPVEPAPPSLPEDAHYSQAAPL